MKKFIDLFNLKPGDIFVERNCQEKFKVIRFKHKDNGVEGRVRALEAEVISKTTRHKEKVDFYYSNPTWAPKLFILLD